MWTKSYSKTVTSIKPEQIWKIWSDVNNRPQWDTDTEWAELIGRFEKGAVFYFKPKGGPKLSMEITECTPNQSFTDCFKFPFLPFARLYGIHQMEPTEEGLKITTTIKVEGLLGWMLKKCIAEKVAAELPEQTDMMIKLASQIK